MKSFYTLKAYKGEGSPNLSVRTLWMVPFTMFDFLIFKLFIFFYFFQISALDRLSIYYTNPGKNDNVYIGKTNGSHVHEQKRYLLWPIRDILEILNENSLSQESTFASTFDTELSFSLFYRFLKMHKQYIYNSKIPHRVCVRFVKMRPC